MNTIIDRLRSDFPTRKIDAAYSSDLRVVVLDIDGRKVHVSDTGVGLCLNDIFRGDKISMDDSIYKTLKTSIEMADSIKI